jgi:hypothetical protein
MTPGLHLTIGTSPSLEPSLREDLGMLKFGLLYGDTVRLCSPAISTFIHWGNLRTRFREATDRDEKRGRTAALIALAVTLAYTSPSSQARRHAEALRNAAWRGDQTPEAAAAVTRAVEEMDRLYDICDEVLAAPQMITHLREIISALDSGIAQLQEIEWNEPESAIRAFVEEITASVLSGETYPFLDSRTGELFSKFIPDKDSAASAAGAGRHVHLAARLLERLPVFEQSTVAEILDIRREMQVPLVRFRSAMLKAAEQISLAPWDRSFGRDAESLIQREVKPAILEIEESVRDAKIHKHLQKPLAEGGWKLSAAGAVAVGVAHALGAPDLLTGILGGTLPVMPLIHSAMSSWRAESQRVERHPFYLYYRLASLA